MGRGHDVRRITGARLARYRSAILLGGLGGLAALLALVNAQHQDYQRQVDTIVQAAGARAVDQDPALRAAVEALETCRAHHRARGLSAPGCWPTVAAAVDARDAPALTLAFAQLQRAVESAVAALAVPWPLRWWLDRSLS